MNHTVVVGRDLAKDIFQVHEADAGGGKTFNKKLRAEEVIEFFENPLRHFGLCCRPLSSKQIR
ncbi:hypothetical protein [Rhizobium sp. ZPR3]|uniref:IS110 family transposase n=2 Tax=unclassified Rhizobium TaxID=2613769 RepID=A0AAU7SAG9_9HYPH